MDADQIFTIKAGDTEPPLEYTLLDGDGLPADLNEATVVLRLRAVTGVLILYAATVVDLPTATVRVSWGGLTPVPAVGLYEAEWHVTWVNEFDVPIADVTYPNGSYFLLRVLRALI